MNDKDPIVKVTRTYKNRYIVRVGNGWEIVPSKEDVGLSIKSQLRWENKLGSPSPMADASRDRTNKKCINLNYRRLAWGRGPCHAKIP